MYSPFHRSGDFGCRPGAELRVDPSRAGSGSSAQVQRPLWDKATLPELLRILDAYADVSFISEEFKDRVAGALALWWFPCSKSGTLRSA